MEELLSVEGVVLLSFHVIKYWLDYTTNQPTTLLVEELTAFLIPNKNASVAY
jgi:hypothetical protein